MLQEIGTRMKWIKEEIKPGPATEDAVICGFRTVVQPTDDNNNYLYHAQRNPEEFAAVNVLAIVTGVLDMYKRVLAKLPGRQKLEWPWGQTPLQVYPQAGQDKNAYYSREERALKFFYFRNSSGKTVYTGNSFDIISHETGHAVLDCLKPGWEQSNNPYTHALHESFGDITAIFAILDDLEMCESVVAHCKGDLHEHSFFAEIGEEFGTGLGLKFGLRNADTDRNVDQVTSEPHDLSEVFTSAIYDILSDKYTYQLKNDDDDPAMILNKVGNDLCKSFIAAILASPDTDATFYDVAKCLMRSEYHTATWKIMNDNFTKRKILDVTTSLIHTTESLIKILENYQASNRLGHCGYIKHAFK